MTDFDLAAYADLDPAQFSALVKSAPKSQLEAVVDGPSRDALLSTIFARMPALFRPEKAGSTNAVIRWDITSPSGSAVWNVVIADGTCTIHNRKRRMLQKRGFPAGPEPEPYDALTSGPQPKDGPKPPIELLTADPEPEPAVLPPAVVPQPSGD